MKDRIMSQDNKSLGGRIQMELEEMQKCWQCRSYMRPKSIMFGLNSSEGICIINNDYKKCKSFKKSFWKALWDRISQPV